MDKDVVEKCLAFCQALSSSNHLFSFNLKIGSDSFNFDLKELAKSSCVKKKKSPSQMRREMKRRDERKRAATKAEEDIAKVSDKSAMVTKPKCDPCGTSFNSEEELNTHNESDHKELSTPEKERSIESCSELQLTPIHIQRDEEKHSEQEGASSPVPIASPPPTFFKCHLKQSGGGKCGETFGSEKDLKSHAHRKHDYCIEHQYRYKNATVPVCPAPGVPSGRCISMNLAYCRHNRDCLLQLFPVGKSS